MSEMDDAIRYMMGSLESDLYVGTDTTAKRLLMLLDRLNVRTAGDALYREAALQSLSDMLAKYGRLSSRLTKN